MEVKSSFTSGCWSSVTQSTSPSAECPKLQSSNQEISQSTKRTPISTAHLTDGCRHNKRGQAISSNGAECRALRKLAPHATTRTSARAPMHPSNGYGVFPLIPPFREGRGGTGGGLICKERPTPASGAALLIRTHANMDTHIAHIRTHAYIRTYYGHTYHAYHNISINLDISQCP